MSRPSSRRATARKSIKQATGQTRGAGETGRRWQRGRGARRASHLRLDVLGLGGESCNDTIVHGGGCHRVGAKEGAPALREDRSLMEGEAACGSAEARGRGCALPLCPSLLTYDIDGVPPLRSKYRRAHFFRGSTSLETGGERSWGRLDSAETAVREPAKRAAAPAPAHNGAEALLRGAPAAGVTLGRAGRPRASPKRHARALLALQQSTAPRQEGQSRQAGHSGTRA